MSGLVGSGARRACTAGRGDAVVSAVDGRQRCRLFVVQIPLITPFPCTPSEAIRAETKAGSPMKNWFKTLVATCAVIPFAQCAMLPGTNVARAAEPTTAAAAATADADPALWVVKDEDTTIYLFGTVHVLKPGLSWFDEAVNPAFDASAPTMRDLVKPEDRGEPAEGSIQG